MAETAKMTVTEALAEIKTIAKRLEKKKQAVLLNVARDGRMLDPLAKDGGSSEKFVAAERQAIRDLEDRLERRVDNWFTNAYSGWWLRLVWREDKNGHRQD